MKSGAEVEQVLTEIRQHLRAAGGRAPAATPEKSRSQSLADLEANIAVTGRAWARLPPVMSDRRGWTARLEVWIKRQLKRATNWFTWEQINFNAAAHNALRAVHSTLASQEERQAELRAQVATLEAKLREIETLRDELESRARLAERGEARR